MYCQKWGEQMDGELIFSHYDRDTGRKVFNKLYRCSKWNWYSGHDNFKSHYLNNPKQFDENGFEFRHNN